MLRSLLLLIPLGALTAAQQTPADEDRIPVLIVSGANNHDWEWTTPSLKSMLEESGRFTVDVTYEPSKDLADAERLGTYAALILDYNGPRWGEAAEAAFLAAVRGGTGVAVIHAANNAFDGWVEYETLVGHCWRDGTGHGRFHPFDVEIEDRDHPITRTLPDFKAHPDELYHRLRYMHEAEYRRLASAMSTTESGGTGQRELMITTLQFGEGRVFHTPLGHVWKGGRGRESHEDPQFRSLVVRGTEWAATGEVSDGFHDQNTLPEWDRRAGWRLLFDGKTLDGWRGFGKDAVPEGWTVESGCIRRVGAAGDIITTETFGDFELEFDFMIAAGTNSGIKYRIEEKGGAPIGPEYQVLDNARHLKAELRHSCGSLYAIHEPDTGGRGPAIVQPPGRWNRGRIVARGNRIEHWLNGDLLVETVIGSKSWNASKNASKFKDRADFATPKPGHVLLQDHGGEVWFRNLRIRDFDALGDRQVELLPASGLEGWTESGDASWQREGDTVIGAVDGGGQSFLRTDATFTDFLFEVDVKLDVKGNSGIQFRSFLEGKRVVGYQAEIDPSARAWSGGIFFEGRGWRCDLKNNPKGRAAFDLDGWNRYRIQTVGEHLRVWVNGVPTGRLDNAEVLEGFLAFQVHSGKQGQIRWRRPRLWDLSMR